MTSKAATLKSGASWLFLAVGVLFGFEGCYRVLAHDFAKTPWLTPMLIHGIATVTLLLSFATFAKVIHVDRHADRSGDLWVPVCALLALSQIERLVAAKDGYEWSAILLCLFSSGVGFWIAFRDPKKWETRK